MGKAMTGGVLLRIGGGMTPTIILASVLAVAGCVLIALGWPLMRGRVKPNGLYGFRTATSLSSEAIWYSTNRLTGQIAFAAGWMMLAAVGVMLWLAVSPEVLAMVGVGIALVAALLMVVLGLSLQNRLAAAGRGGSPRYQK
jgi:hypothetical protein